MNISKESIPVGFVTLRAAARRLNLSEATLRNHIARGQLSAIRIPGPYMVAETIVQALVDQQAA